MVLMRVTCIIEWDLYYNVIQGVLLPNNVGIICVDNINQI